MSGVICNESIGSLLQRRGMSAGTCPPIQFGQGLPSPKQTPPHPEPAFGGTHCARREARQPYMDGVYMLPLREERSREGLVFWLKISWLAAWNAFSTSLLV